MYTHDLTIVQLMELVDFACDYVRARERRFSEQELYIMGNKPATRREWLDHVDSKYESLREKVTGE